MGQKISKTRMTLIVSKKITPDTRCDTKIGSKDSFKEKVKHSLKNCLGCLVGKHHTAFIIQIFTESGGIFGQIYLYFFD